MTTKKPNSGLMQKGTQLWKLRKRHGDRKAYETGDALWIGCIAYFEWALANPLIEEKIFCSNGIIKRAKIEKMRAFTLAGLCVHLGITKRCWENYRKASELMDTCAEVDTIIYEQKFTGAAAEMLNPNIIARDLGLSEKVDNAHSGSVGLHDISDEELDRRIAQREQELRERPQSTD